MRRLFFTLVLLAGPALGAEPKALLSGPETALTRTIVRLDPGGSVSDRMPLVRLNKGPEKVTPEPRFNRTGALVCYEVVPTRAGSYEFYTVATGEPPKDAPDPLFDFAFWTVVVGGGPGPQPPVVTPAPYVPPVAPSPPVAPPVVPQPTPTPPPNPTPPPSPIPTSQIVRVPLNAVLAYSSDPMDPSANDWATVITDKNLGASLKSLGVTWFPWPYSTSMIDSLGLRPWVGSSGPPVLLIYEQSLDPNRPGKIFDQNGYEAAQVAGTAFRPPTTAAGVIELFKRLKGQQ